MFTKRKYSSKNSKKLFNSKDDKADKDGKADNDDNKCPPHVQVTPQMIRAAVKRLQYSKLYVNLNLITDYLRRNFPVDRDKKKFKEELIKKLDCAVRVGLIVKHRQDAYCLPNIRDEANNVMSAFSAFWEMYRKYKKSPFLRYGNQNKKQSTAKRKLRNMIKYLKK